MNANLTMTLKLDENGERLLARLEAMQAAETAARELWASLARLLEGAVKRSELKAVLDRHTIWGQQ